MSKIFIGLGGSVFLAIYLVLIMVFGGVVLRDLWLWFVIPLFPTLPALTIAQAAGVKAVIGFASGLQFPPKDESKFSWTKVVIPFAAYALVWFMGWVLKGFV